MSVVWEEGEKRDDILTLVRQYRPMVFCFHQTYKLEFMEDFFVLLCGVLRSLAFVFGFQWALLVVS
jgi:hypothetical protein